MAERGRPRQGEYRRKTQMLAARVKPETRARLRDAAAESRRSITQELEYRLIRSFDEDVTMFERFGGRRNYALMRLIAAAMDQALSISHPLDRNPDWSADPFKYDQFVRVVRYLLEEFRPPGDRDYPTDDEIRRMWLGSQGEQAAAGALLEIKGASPELSLDPKNINPAIRSDLGAWVDRIGRQPGRGPIGRVVGNAEAHRQKAEEMEAEAMSRVKQSPKGARTRK
jgi:hypothetical protein